MDAFVAEVRDLFETPLGIRRLHSCSERLQEEYKQKLQDSDISMLPSFISTLPTGHERGTFLALDVGGSNFRLALVVLTGRDGGKSMHVKRTQTFSIDARVRSLRGETFFEWIADRIQDMLEIDKHESDGGAEPLSMGLAWSFPIKQTSAKSGELLKMGKGFAATIGVQGQDLAELIMRPCRQRGLNVQLQSTINDSEASLLAQAYRNSTTRMSLILGTGTNAAALLPVDILAKDKFGQRSEQWYSGAERVIVNTELSMHGKTVWPCSTWDDQLNRDHELPDFQPLEHLVGGRYLGEIVRLILVQAVEESALFGGDMPTGLETPYTLDSGMLGAFECNPDRSMSEAGERFVSSFPTCKAPTMQELEHIHTICQLVTNRAAAFLATAVHALWALPSSSHGQNGSHSNHVTIASNGSILEKYPTFRERCQHFLDELAILSGAEEGTIMLEMALDSSIYGAAVAAACINE